MAERLLQRVQDRQKRTLAPRMEREDRFDLTEVGVCMRVWRQGLAGRHLLAPVVVCAETCGKLHRQSISQFR